MSLARKMIKMTILRKTSSTQTIEQCPSRCCFFVTAGRKKRSLPPRKTNMTMKIPPSEYEFPIENSDFPTSCWFSGSVNPLPEPPKRSPVQRHSGLSLPICWWNLPCSRPPHWDSWASCGGSRVSPQTVREKRIDNCSIPSFQNWSLFHIHNFMKNREKHMQYKYTFYMV